MGALALGGQKTLHVQVDGVVVGLDAKHRIIQIHRLLRLGSFAAVNVEFHYASGLRMTTVEPLWPGTAPFTTSKPSSGMTFNTSRFSMVTRELPI